MKKTLLLNVALLAAFGLTSQTSARSLAAVSAKTEAQLKANVNAAYVVYKELGLNPTTGKAAKGSTPLANTSTAVRSALTSDKAVKKLLGGKPLTAERLQKDAELASKLVAELVKAAASNETLKTELAAKVEAAKAAAKTNKPVTTGGDEPAPAPAPAPTTDGEEPAPAPAPTTGGDDTTTDGDATTGDDSTTPTPIEVADNVDNGLKDLGATVGLTAEQVEGIKNAAKAAPKAPKLTDAEKAAAIAEEKRLIAEMAAEFGIDT